MNEALLLKARESADHLLAEHPVFSAHRNNISILISGSLAAGFADELSDIDLWLLCKDEVSACISEKCTANRLRFDSLPPNKLTFKGTDVHCFIFPYSKFRQGLEMYDDMTLFYVANSIICHDADACFASMIEPYVPLPDDVLKDKIKESYGWVVCLLFGLRTVLMRYQPVPWIETMGYILHRTLNLCCWLDGKAPGTTKWVMRQAESCSTAHILIPAVMSLIRAFSKALENELPQTDDNHPLLLAADVLSEAARQAVDIAGYADIPTPTPVPI
ncbi:MAG: hypothetical protein ACYC0V_16635 [Armatimonadota bacterium]